MFAGIYFDLNDLHIAPAIAHPSSGVSQARISFPRSGDAVAEITLDNGALGVRVADQVGGAFTADGDWSTLAVTSAADWTAHRSDACAAARRRLPAPR